MLKARLIPCLDVKDGRVVKGVNFVNLRDAGDPVEIAKAYDAAGADELCFLDITASHENRGIMLDVVTRTAEACFMPLTVGGGIRVLEDIRALLLAGADKASINSAAVADRSFVARAAEKFGSLFTPQPIRTSSEPFVSVREKQDWPPRHYVLCKAYDPSPFHAIAARVRNAPGWTYGEFDALHDVVRTHPLMVADMISDRAQAWGLRLERE